MTWRVAYQGESGAYGELAVTRYGHDHHLDTYPVPCETMDGVVDSVRRGIVEMGVIPVRNTIIGPVIPGQNALRQACGVRTIGEIMVPVQHCVLGINGATMQTITHVESHPVALAQCQSFFDRNADLAARAVHDTAGAARMVADRRVRSVAAIAGRHAAERYGLAVLQENIQDHPDNTTRFVVIMSELNRTIGRCCAGPCFPRVDEQSKRV